MTFVACIRTCWGILLIDRYVGNGNTVRAGVSIHPTLFTLHRHKRPIGGLTARQDTLVGVRRDVGVRRKHGLETIHATAI